MKKFTLNTLIIALAFFSIGKVNAQDVIDLTVIDDANALVDTLDGVTSGSIILLKPGMTYNAGGFAFDKSVTIQSSEPANLMLPIIDCAANFNLADGATVDSIVFKNIELTGEYDARYAFNINVAATLGKLMFDGCYLHDLRGMVRMKDNGPGTLDHYVVNNCMVSMIRDYGVLTVDINTWMVNHIVLTNSTFSRIRAFLTSRNTTTSLTIDGCTINEVPAAGQRMFRWRESGQEDVTNGIMVKNTLWGTGWDEDGTGSTAFDGYDGLGATSWTFENTYSTNDLVFAADKDTIHALYDMVYDGTGADLWKAPTYGNFNYIDGAFYGIGNAGDPRWSELNAEGVPVWNVSDTAFTKWAGDLVETQTIAGLTVFAADGKAVTIDANNKTLDDMSFTHRMKLGGSGGFDGDGQPVNRVLSIDVMGNTDITVAAMSSSSGSDRVLAVAAGSKDNIICEFQALGASLTDSTFQYVGGPTKLYFYSPSSGVNVYYLTAYKIPVLVTGITLDGGAITTDNGTLQLTAGITPEDADNKILEWSVERTGAGNATVSNTGLVKAIEDGDVTVWAKATDGSGVEASATVTISGQVVTGWEINIIKNADFNMVETNGQGTYWGGWTDASPAHQVVDGVSVHTPLATADVWRYQFSQSGLTAEPNVDYKFAFKAWADAARPFNVDFEDTEALGYNRYGASDDPRNSPDYAGRSDWTFDITTDPTWYEFNVNFDQIVEGTVQKVQFMLGTSDVKTYIDSVLLVPASKAVAVPSEYGASKLKVYPNPANGNTMITVMVPMENSMVSIYDCLGRKVEELKSTNDRVVFNVSSYARGLYFVKVNDEVIKFVK